MKQTDRIAGWREIVDLPGWDIQGLNAKLDTGARSSCIDARDMQVMEGDDHGTVRFQVPTPTGMVEREETILDWRMVRDSGGHNTLRPVIAVRMRLADQEWDDEVTLYDRSDISHRVLVGRRVMAGRFVVDPSRAFVLTQAPQAAEGAEGAGGGDGDGAASV